MNDLAMYVAACKANLRVLDCCPIYALLDPLAVVIRSEEIAYVQAWLTVNPDSDEFVNGYPNVSVHLFDVSE